MTRNADAAIALAHLRLPVTDVAAAISFFEALGAETDINREGFAVVELMDSTRLQLRQSSEPVASRSDLQFDFKVADIDAAWADYRAKGLSPGEITRRRPGHDTFLISGPDGCAVQINSGFNRA